MRAHAIWLDVAHRMRTFDGAAFGVEVPAGQRALDALAAAARQALGREFGVPLGYRVVDGDAWCVAVDPVPGGAWLPLRTWAAEHVTAWQVYVDTVLGGWQPPTTALEVFCFGNEPALASQLAHHVIKGTKRATASWVAATERDGGTPPHAGMVSIVTDGFGVPLCAIETTRVERRRFGDATAEFAEAEGEGDRSLADWRAGHLRYFEAEAVRIGIAFTDDADIDFEQFRVLHVFQRAA